MYNSLSIEKAFVLLRHSITNSFYFILKEDKNQILKIYGIYRTNCFENGVAIHFARFNHSCCSNAEAMWNEVSTVKYDFNKKTH